MRRVPEALALAGQGFAGCRHTRRALGHKRQLLLLDEASLAQLGLEVGQLKENVVVAGLALQALPPGQRLALGPEVRVELSEPCVPCWKLDALRPGLLQESWGRRDQHARAVLGAVLLLDVNPDAPRPIVPKLP
ncbi:MOSC domain-containing protein [Aggregicoccus sp. 17bor-14]|nr:MOSC domain-containing protein [Aggregicoccus sp. 17bor-14]